MEHSQVKKILVIGSTVADIIINLDFLPTTAQDVHVKSQSMSLGGCAHNVADMIRHFGVPYTLFSPVGTGLYGDFVRNQLAAKGLASPMPTPDMANGCCYCFVEESGERTFIVDHGAEYLFYKEWFDALNLSKLRCAYICGLEIEDKTGSTIVDFLEESGLPVFYAPGPRICLIDNGLMERIFALRPVLHLNEDEICRYTGCDTIAEAAAALYKKTHNTIIITNGANGAYYYNGTECSGDVASGAGSEAANDTGSTDNTESGAGLVHVPPVPVAQIVDTIGAGDGHCGAVMAGLSMGLSMYDAITKANAASSLVVSVKGGVLSDEEFAAGGIL